MRTPSHALLILNDLHAGWKPATTIGFGLAVIPLRAMEMTTRVLATTHEVSLKGGNRKWFEGKLTDNIRRALADLPLERIARPAWRVLIHFREPVPFTEVARRLRTVFGLQTVRPAYLGGHTIEELSAAIEPHLEGLAPSSFAVRCLRADKSYPFTSMDVDREVGSFIQERTKWPVNLKEPDLVVHILLDLGGFHFGLRRIKAPGGLPVGTGGKGLCLLSGGIDSPVAAYMMMKRGMRLDFVHFHSVPRTDPASLEKVVDLVRVLGRYQGPCRLAMVPLLQIQEEIAARCPTELRVLLYRRFMLRLACRVSRRWKDRALITGESLGQVASQTIENMAAVETVTNRTILRPLIGLDKQEIIAIGRRAGTYDLSIQPHFDCCSFLVPDHPATRSEADQLARAEEALDVDELVRTAGRSTERSRITDFVPWQEMPLPPDLEG